MLTKFETKSGCVRGLSFHRKNPWILASLDSGVIEIWDYSRAIRIHQFQGHSGPVRGVHFHDSLPIFVSGGDDYKVNVWDYRLCICLSTLHGHLDCVLTVQLHHEYPLIVSASDDQTIRIWNRQSKTLIWELPGHQSAAFFHPKEKLLVSISSEGCLCVWDVDVIRELPRRHTNIFTRARGPMICYFDILHQGVKRVSFHPTRPLVVFGAGRKIKIFSLNVSDQVCKKVDTLRGHTDNVSCALFHSRQNIIVSCSEDMSIRVWDATIQTCLHTFRREHDRFWILSVHPDINLLAAGHDSGMIVFKLERERPAFSVCHDSMIFIKDGTLHMFDYSTHETFYLVPPIHPPGYRTSNQGPQTLSYSSTSNAVLVSSDVDEGSYELYVIVKERFIGTLEKAKRGVGGPAVFLAQNRFAVLEKSFNHVLVKNLENGIVNRTVLPIATDAIFYAGSRNLLCKAEDMVFKFDLQQGNVVGELQTAAVIRYVVWSPDMVSVALLSKHSIVIADKKLVHRCTIRETMNVKSGAWDWRGVFLYTTLTHIKYCLPNGDNGIIKTLDAAVYITKIYRNAAFFLDREGKNHSIFIDSTEYSFKLSLLEKRVDHAIRMMQNPKLCVQAMIAYMQQKGFSHIALDYVKDENTRFNLALECGNIVTAFESAKEINEKDQWHRLGVEALRQGNTEIVEYAYQKTENFVRLSFLYLITGNLEKLSKMMRTAEVENDVMNQFRVALYLGDIRVRVKMLENAGLLPLAYITATVYGLHDIAHRIAEELKDGTSISHLPEVKRPSLSIPPSPVLCAGNWPMVNKGDLDDTDRGGHKRDGGTLAMN